jgi:hypothetical protein
LHRGFRSATVATTISAVSAVSTVFGAHLLVCWVVGLLIFCGRTLEKKELRQRSLKLLF